MQIALSHARSETGRKWLKRAGAAGFWFFFVKGLMWLAAPLVFYLAL